MTAMDDSSGGRTDGVPMWKLERYVLGELPGDEVARLRARIEADADLRRQVEALQSASADVLQAYPAPWMARQIERRAAAGAANGARAPWHLRWPVPVAAAALLAVAAVPLLRSTPDPAGSLTETAAPAGRFLTEGVRVKGTGARLYLHRKTPGGTERLENGAAARRGDLVRLQYDAAGATHGLILSVDGSGTVTRHLPLQGATAAPLAPGSPVSLETAYELDDAPRWERFFLVTADHDFDAGAVLAAARQAVTTSTLAPPDSLTLPPDLEQTAVTVTKEGAPR